MSSASPRLLKPQDHEDGVADVVADPALVAEGQRAEEAVHADRVVAGGERVEDGGDEAEGGECRRGTWTRL